MKLSWYFIVHAVPMLALVSNFTYGVTSKNDLWQKQMSIFANSAVEKRGGNLGLRMMCEFHPRNCRLYNKRKDKRSWTDGMDMDSDDDNAMDNEYQLAEQSNAPAVALKTGSARLARLPPTQHNRIPLNTLLQRILRKMPPQTPRYGLEDVISSLGLQENQMAFREQPRDSQTRPRLSLEDVLASQGEWPTQQEFVEWDFS